MRDTILGLSAFAVMLIGFIMALAVVFLDGEGKDWIQQKHFSTSGKITITLGLIVAILGVVILAAARR